MADTLITGTTLVEKESRSIGDVPIGGIVAWVKSLPGVPNLAEGWVECDGAVLSDALSPLNGQTIPDLNDGIFLEGQTTSGATGGAASNSHIHTVSDTAVASGAGALGISADTTSTPSIPENRPPFYTVVWIMRVR